MWYLSQGFGLLCPDLLLTGVYLGQRHLPLLLGDDTILAWTEEVCLVIAQTVD